MATCKACGDEIRWIETRAGKRMPVDADSLGHYQLQAGITVVTEQGDTLRGTSDTVGVSVYGYTPHWATCKFAEQFRTRRA